MNASLPNLINPFSYPLAVTTGGLLLFVGVRFAVLPNAVIIPLATGATIAVAYVRKSQEPTPEKERLRQVHAELQGVRNAAQQLQHNAQILRDQANAMLRQTQLSPVLMEVLAAVQYGCDLAIAVPDRVDTLERQLPQRESLLDAKALQEQLQTVRSQKMVASGSAQQSLQRLEESIQRNLSLIHAHKDDRQAQIHNLDALIQDLAGVLQRLQNTLETANLKTDEYLDSLQALVDEMSRLQQEMDLFV